VEGEFSWSVSRHDTFATCRRRYYYSYYAALEDPEVRRLKRLSALPLWAGNVVHETIETFLKEHDALPLPEAREALVHAAVHDRMASEWHESEAGSERFRLFEHEYGVEVSADDKKIAVGTVMRSLRHFFRSPSLQDAFAAGRERWLSVEDLASFGVDGVTVLLRMDLAFRDVENRVVIVDWKTGQREGRFSEVQLAGYALYAAEQGWVRSPDELRTELAYLAVPRYVRRRIADTQLQRARDFVRRSAESMRALLVDVEANRARIEDFPMIDRPRVCRRCNFRRLCFPRDVPGAGPRRAAAGGPEGARPGHDAEPDR